MSSVDSQQFIETVQSKKEELPVIRLGTIVSAGSGVQVQFDGEDKPSEKSYKMTATFRNHVGGRVVLARVGDSYIILDSFS